LDSESRAHQYTSIPKLGVGALGAHEIVVLLPKAKASIRFHARYSRHIDGQQRDTYRNNPEQWKHLKHLTKEIVDRVEVIHKRRLKRLGSVVERPMFWL
jgi:hypothetical protein